MLFSILIPAIPSRLDRLKALYDKLLEQAKDYPGVEILAFLDNKRRSVGLKRDALVQIARGAYLAFVDDDDHVYGDYVKEIHKAITAGTDPDVIVFNEHAVVNGGNIFTVRFGIEYENQEAHKVKDAWADITRKPFHSCVWSREIAQSEHFPDASYGEDWHWCKRLIPKVKTQHRIDMVLSKYVYDDRVTEAEHIFPHD